MPSASVLAALLAVGTLAAQDPKIIATLVPTSAGGRLQGTLSLQRGRKDGESRARVTLVSAPANAQLGWVVRLGQCGENGAELGPLAAYRPLMTRGDGSVELAVNLPFALPRANAYHVDILRERGSSDVIACGGLSEEGAPGD
jgi:hypothetical protein